MSITSDEVNYLVFRYLQESGFQHAAFTFGYESLVHKSEINGNDVPPGALISFIQKGLQYVELEANLTAEGKSEYGENTPSDFTLLQPEELLTKDVGELRRTIQRKKEQRERSQKQKDRDREKHGGDGGERDRETKPKSKKSKTTASQGSKDKAEKKANGGPAPMDTDSPREDGKAGGSNGVNSKDGGAEAEEKGHDPEAMIPPEGVTTLRGHTSEVFIIQWNPQSSLLASGSGDSTARIWDLTKKDQEPLCLNHTTADSKSLKDGESPSMGGQGGVVSGSAGAGTKSRDVTTLDWSSDGKYLATGSYDGQARVWDTSGKLVKTLNGHMGPIFSLKWNKEGNYLLSGSVDKTAIVWDVGLSKKEGSDGQADKATGAANNILQQYSLHAAPTLDVDWRTNDSFATCSTDTMIYVCKLGETLPIKTFSAHTDEVNAISWDSTGTYLASCSDDYTAKVWTLTEDTPLYNFEEHKREIYTIKWSPKQENKPLLLASASFDATIRLWEMDKGTCLYALKRHSDPVYSVAFSPCGAYLATGSFDRNLHIWSAKTGDHLKTFKGEGGIFEVCWNEEGDKVAACFSNSTISIVDFLLKSKESS
ncbi:WD40 repeat domain-containing protein [Chloropicon primus]|uniref:WD40 repeat domain-containing protein n=1 Tax=Chloropicon primus TaxID=1764295 RepID=A0A5B8MVI1_9CHLO|nr:WD40 repeat domain-containing protein [Chloropicon primus]|mmetsp:Transcript_12610/g.35181  ORF Transcript_12610/g.35181 Transcript_12610/m.35181 type:complete len:595 (-) Transcript_12610:77-1861(-)|eukprot:QDZ24539.1 WD40 repeat domain-containing protein [Chloropicon primus]